MTENLTPIGPSIDGSPRRRSGNDYGHLARGADNAVVWVTEFTDDELVPLADGEQHADEQAAENDRDAFPYVSRSTPSAPGRVDVYFGAETPRPTATIRTTAELAALPVGSVVLSHCAGTHARFDGLAWQKDECGAGNGYTPEWRGARDGEWLPETKMVPFLGGHFTVLYRPDAGVTR